LQPDVFAKCKSIRDALAHLSGLDENLNPKPVKPRKSRTGSSATALEPPEPAASTDPAVVLGEIDASDIIDNIKDDADKFEEVAKASIVKLSPDKVFDALTKAWTADQFRDLSKRVNLYLATLPSDLAIPRERRTGASAQPSQG
jgi:hypothetical protein